MRTTALLLALSLLLVAAPPANLELPAGLRLRLRLVDYVNTEHEPVGMTYRALFEEKLSLGKDFQITEKSRALLRLLPDGAGTGVTLEWFAVRLDEVWFETRAVDDTQAAATTALIHVEDRRPAANESKPLVSRGPHLYIPPGSTLQFELKRRVRLVRVGRENIY